MRNIFLVIFALWGSVLLQAQNYLYKPEHVTWDHLNRRYLVSNYGNGKIVSIDESGNQEVIIEGLTNCLGIHIIDTVIYITQGQLIHLYGLNSYAHIQTLNPNVSNWLDGLTDDCKGNLYAVENAGKIHKINLETYSDTVIINGGLPQYPQDIAYDSLLNRLILVCWEAGSPLISIDLEDYSVNEITATTSGQYDGIVIDSLKNLYVSSWLSGGRIYKWVFPYENEPEIFSQGHAGPAGLCLNPDDQMLAVPNFNSNEISYLPLFPTGIEERSELPVITISNSLINIQNPERSELTVYDLTGRCLGKRTIPPGRSQLSFNEMIPYDGLGFFILNLNSAKYRQGMKILVR